MHASVRKQRNLSESQQDAQIQLIDSMVLNTLLTGLEPKLGNAIRASNPLDTLSAISRIKRELQLNYFEHQKIPNRNVNSALPKSNQTLKHCSFCKRTGHTVNECRQRQQALSPNNNYNSLRFQQQSTYQPNYQRNSQTPQQRPYVTPQQNQNPQPQRPPVIAPNPNFGSPRPPIIQPNPNFKPFNNRRTLHFNQNQLQQENDYDQNYYTANSPPNDIPYNSNSHLVDESNASQEYYTGNNSEAYGTYTETDYYDTAHNNDKYSQDILPINQDFPISQPPPADPPNLQIQDHDLFQLESQIQMMNLDDFNPNINFPEQSFL